MEHIFATVEKKRALWKDCTALTEGAAWMAPLVKGILVIATLQNHYMFVFHVLCCSIGRSI